jgi:hypothetical protein
MREINKLISMMIFCICIHGVACSQGVPSKTKSRLIQNQAVDGFYLELPTKYNLPPEIQAILMKYVQGNDDFESKYPLYFKNSRQMETWLVSSLSKVRTTLIEKALDEETMFKTEQENSHEDSIEQMEHKRDIYLKLADNYDDKNLALSIDAKARNQILRNGALANAKAYTRVIKLYYDAASHTKMALDINKDMNTLIIWQSNH